MTNKITETYDGYEITYSNDPEFACIGSINNKEVDVSDITYEDHEGFLAAIVAAYEA